MLIVTNRNLQPNKPATERFGKRMNANGPQELRMAEAKKVHGRWSVNILDDKLPYKGHRLWASEYAFLNLQARMRRNKRNALFFVHGFNNDFESVLERGALFEKNYGVEVVAFTWPADGGGAKGVLSYKSDKRDAVASVNALDRTLEKLSSYLSHHADPRCEQGFSMILHSMGNYLYKNLLKSSVYNGETLIFDNIIMAAADVNNYGHSSWIDRMEFRRRLYVTINENDTALLASRMKFGEKQHARLGHLTENLTANKARYVDFTKARRVGNSHAYFEGGALRNARVRRFFKAAVNGHRAEEGLSYDPHSGAYRIS